MRFLQLVTSGPGPSGGEGRAGPSDSPLDRSGLAPDPKHIARVNQAIAAAVASGELLATGWIGKRATAAARVALTDGVLSVEDPPADPPEGGSTWMAAGGYGLTEFASKEAAIASAAGKLRMMGGGVVELIQVGELHPPSVRAPRPSSPELPAGVVPYLTIDGAADAAAFYQRAFHAREVARMASEDGKRLMHCHLEINGGALMLADHFPERGLPAVQRSASDTMQLVVADGQVWWDRAIAAGCTPKLPFALAPWGDRYGQLVDPFGVTWAINSPAPR